MNATKFFRNGKTFSSYCRMKYGQSKMIWDDTSLWCHSGKFAIGFDEAAADAKFSSKNSRLKPEHCPEAFDDENYAERQAEDMAAYMASGAGLAAYYEDRDAGYAY